MNSLKAMYGCGLNFFIKLAYNSLFLYKFAVLINNKDEVSHPQMVILNGRRETSARIGGYYDENS